MFLLVVSGCQNWQSLSRECLQRRPVDCPPDAVICDSFEDDATLSASIQNVSPGGALDFSDACVRSGARSASVFMAPAPVGEAVQASIRWRDESALPRHYARAFVLVKEPLPAAALKLIRIAESGTTIGVMLRVLEGRAVVSNTVVDTIHDTGVVFPTERWACIEIGMEDGAPGLVRAWLDGVLITSVSETTQDPSVRSFTELGILSVDILDAPLETAVQLYIDDFAASQTPIGCGT